MKKGLYILTLIFLLQTVASCCKHVRFFDYSAMYVMESNAVVGMDEVFEMTLLADDLRYIAGWQGFGHGETLAFSCDKGWDGAKYPIVDVSISSTSDFDSTRVSGQPLEDLFVYEVFVGGGEFEYRNLDGLEEHGSEHLKLRLTARPTGDPSHVFDVVLTKSNGEVVKVVTQEVTWLE